MAAHAPQDNRRLTLTKMAAVAGQPARSFPSEVNTGPVRILFEASGLPLGVYKLPSLPPPAGPNPTLSHCLLSPGAGARSWRSGLATFPGMFLKPGPVLKEDPRTRNTSSHFSPHMLPGLLSFSSGSCSCSLNRRRHFSPTNSHTVFVPLQDLHCTCASSQGAGIPVHDVFTGGGVVGGVHQPIGDGGGGAIVLPAPSHMKGFEKRFDFLKNFSACSEIVFQTSGWVKH
ncbi:uncharacterized protein LOC122544821 [Chiloscyllium plagiosum]|uniref:uncharacterized protein LOC122544821 n=1 Tax=Chiloscyllium plagiosum TaxID=36176 RepID=UPI001CB84129|nr:uncharacterized protein LOC122544821 [Chiloscyllium plagiosum]